MPTDLTPSSALLTTKLASLAAVLAVVVGALALGELCAAMEQSGKSRKVEALTALLPRFEAKIVAVDEHLGSFWKKQALSSRRAFTGKPKKEDESMIEKFAIRILALDDEPLMLKLFSHILSMPDFAGAIARSGNYPDLMLSFWREEQPLRA